MIPDGKPMELKLAIAILTDHQRWRKGEGRYSEYGARPQYTAEEVGKALDYAILQLIDKL